MRKKERDSDDYLELLGGTGDGRQLKAEQGESPSSLLLALCLLSAVTASHQSAEAS